MIKIITYVSHIADYILRKQSDLYNVRYVYEFLGICTQKKMFQYITYNVACFIFDVYYNFS